MGRINSSTLDQRAAVPMSRAAMWRSLSASQRLTVERLEANGWLLCFVRSGPKDRPVAVVSQSTTAMLGVVGIDGDLQLTPGLSTRR